MAAQSRDRIDSTIGIKCYNWLLNFLATCVGRYITLTLLMVTAL
ncbi:hypothetical protein FHW36_10923 [Chitinophaga polysaccharea]|uniref:Uncharacterized protein n=1 Tax=Chitinophaga polysaccharea TaxID=1293035 RepID=A0A561PAT0_9BACT|nr:hypothetical protein FHW36_10923 [Chitinophaga polysaccharea]